VQGIESVVLEARSREYVEHRIRAGVLEQPTADLLTEVGAGERLDREGIVHRGVELQFAGERHRIALSELAGGAGIVIYGQTEVVKDLIRLRLDAGAPLLFEAEDVELRGIETDRPAIAFTHEGRRQLSMPRRWPTTARRRLSHAVPLPLSSPHFAINITC